MSKTAIRKTAGASQETVTSRAVAMTIMGVFTLYFFVPIWWLVASSTKTLDNFNSTSSLWFSPTSLSDLVANLGTLFTYADALFPRWMLNSIVYATVAGGIGTLLAVMCGYALAKYQFPGREVIFNIVIGGVLVPATALALPLFLMFTQVNLTNTFWAVFLPSIVSPFGVYLGRIFAASAVPDEIIEAARIDGAGELRTFFSVSIRLMSPAVVTVFLFQFVGIWNNFFLPLIMLRNSDLYPVTLGLFTWNSQVSQFPEMRTLVIVGSLVSIVPLLIGFLILQRYWRNGLSAGGIK
ncbi:carbohydrate ABC transporter permease [Nonomuraea sp. NPDC002799]